MENSKGERRIVIAPKGGKEKAWKELEKKLGSNTRVIDVPLKTLAEPVKKPVEKPAPEPAEKPL